MGGKTSPKEGYDTHLRWVAEIGGKRHEWEAEITEQKPDQKIAWRAVDGHYNSGIVTFEPVSQNETRITVVMERGEVEQGQRIRYLGGASETR